MPNFYPRSPCGERLPRGAGRRRVRGISIHALLAESDNIGQYFDVIVDISIHALLAESDRGGGAKGWPAKHFYPRSPCGERLNAAQKENKLKNISIHALLAESDVLDSVEGRLKIFISIHALLAESDCGD